MMLKIDPKVDFAFKMMLGHPEHPAVTIHFLNACFITTASIMFASYQRAKGTNTLLKRSASACSIRCYLLGTPGII